MPTEAWRAGRGEASEEARRGSLTALTKRQRDVIAAMAQGKSNKEIARDLGLADGTVKIHVSNIFKALNVHNRTQAVLVASNLSERLMGGGNLRLTARQDGGVAGHQDWGSGASGQDATAESEGVDRPSAERDRATDLGREGLAMAG